MGEKVISYTILSRIFLFLNERNTKVTERKSSKSRSHVQLTVKREDGKRGEIEISNLSTYSKINIKFASYVQFGSGQLKSALRYSLNGLVLLIFFRTSVKFNRITIPKSN